VSHLLVHVMVDFASPLADVPDGGFLTRPGFVRSVPVERLTQETVADVSCSKNGFRLQFEGSSGGIKHCAFHVKQCAIHTFSDTI